MISFKEFLAEARMSPLYHATLYERGASILADNYMRPGGEEPGLNKRTVSLTRDFTFAKAWIYEMGGIDDGMIFEIDQLKLSHKYKIVPYSYFGQREIGYMDSARRIPTSKFESPGKNYHFDNQFEEAVIGPIKDFKKYVTKIYISEIHRNYEKNVKTLRKYNIPIYSYKTRKIIN